MFGLIVFLVLAIVVMAGATMVSERRRRSEFSDAMRAVTEIDKYIKEVRK